MSLQLVIILLMTAVIHAVDTSAYAARLAGVRTGRLALARSLYNVLALSSRAANAIAGPLIGSMTDLAVAQGDTDTLLFNYRLLLLATSIGTLIAGLLIPSLSRLLAIGVVSYEKRRSLPRLIVRGVSVRGGKRMWHNLARPRLASVRESRRSPFPKRFLIISILVTAIYSGSRLAALYASALVPGGARTAASLPALINGLGTILMIFVVDPISALVTDEALRRQRPLPDLTYITIWQVGARLLGTLLAQATLWPVGWILATVTRFLVNW